MTQFALNQLVAEAHERGVSVDLGDAAYGPDTGNARGFLSEAMPYYPLLAGLSGQIGASTIVEVGTHFGGSTLALLAGLRAAGSSDPTLITMDVTDLNRERLEAEPEITKVIGDSTQAAFLEETVAHVPAGQRVDLLYIDALKDAAYVLVTLHNAHRAGMNPRYLVLDDITANESMQSLWDAIAARAGDAAYLISADRPDIRNPKYGFAIIDTDRANGLLSSVAEVLDELGLDSSELDRTAPGERFEQVRASSTPDYATVAPDAPVRSFSPSLHAAAYELGHTHQSLTGDAVVCGSADTMVRAVAEGIAANAGVRDPWRRVHAIRPPGTSTSDLLETLGERSELVNATSIDLNVAGWSGRPISMGVLATVHSAGTFARIFREFGPSMLPGSTVLLVADALAPYRLYTAYVLAYLSDYLDVLSADDIGVTVGFRQRIPDDKLRKVEDDRFTLDERLDLIEAFARDTADPAVAVAFRTQGARIALRGEDVQRAAALITEIDRGPVPATPIGQKRLSDLRDKIQQAHTEQDLAQARSGA